MSADWNEGLRQAQAQAQPAGPLIDFSLVLPPPPERFQWAQPTVAWEVRPTLLPTVPA